jgi:hypothetical protein
MAAAAPRCGSLQPGQCLRGGPATWEERARKAWEYYVEELLVKNCVNSWRAFAVKDEIRVAGDDDKLKEEATEAAYRLNLYRVTIANNAATAGNGGGVYSSGTFAAVNCTFSGNSAGGQGGAIANDGFAGLNHCMLAAHTAGTGAVGILWRMRWLLWPRTFNSVGYYDLFETLMPTPARRREMHKEMNTSHFDRILVVDDTTANLQLLTNLLTEHGYTFYPVSDGELALRFVRSTLPDLILLDIRMPGETTVLLNLILSDIICSNE